MDRLFLFLLFLWIVQTKVPFAFLFILSYISCVVYMALKGLSGTRKQLVPYESLGILLLLEELMEQGKQGE